VPAGSDRSLTALTATLKGRYRLAPGYDAASYLDIILLLESSLTKAF